MTKPSPSRARRAGSAAAALLVLTSLGPAAGAASAQVVPSVDVGTHAVDQRGAPAVSGAALAPAVRLRAPLATVDASALHLFAGSGSAGPSGRVWAGSLAGTLATPGVRAFRGELGAAMRRSLGPGLAPVTSTEVDARLRYDAARFGVWASQSTGEAATTEGRRAFGGMGAGFWTRVRGVTITTSLGWMRTRDSTQRESIVPDSVITHWLPGREDTVGFHWDSLLKRSVPITEWRDSQPQYGRQDRRLLQGTLGALAYTDLESGIQWANGFLELGAHAGTRLGLTRGRERSWASATGSLLVSRRAALVAAVGREPEDVARGIPARSYATLGMRLARTPLLGFSGRGLPPVVVREPRASASAAGDFIVQAGAPGSYTLRVRAPGAREVELMGSFTEWQPVAMTPLGNGRWEATLSIPAGVHQLNLRVDGGSWRAPPGLTTTVDGFNGTVGVLVIE